MARQSTFNALVLVSNPLTAPIDAETDLASLHKAVAGLPYAARFAIHHAQADAVGDLLASGDRDPFNVLHFVGHGSADGPNGPGLFFEAGDGGHRLLDRLRLGLVLHPAGGVPEFQLAVLSACHSQRVADLLFSLGVGHIVAVDAGETIYEDAAVRFTCSGHSR